MSAEKNNKETTSQVSVLGRRRQTSSHGNQKAIKKGEQEAGKGQSIPEGVQGENVQGEKEGVQQNTQPETETWIQEQGG